MTAFAKCDGHPCLFVKLHIPFGGAWWAEVTLDNDETLEGRVTIEVGSVSFSGTVVDGGSVGESRSLRVVAGGGGWGTLVSAQHYQNDAGIRSATVLEDAARLAGENLGDLPSIADLGADYVRESGPASRILEDIAGEWWVDLNGVTHVGERQVSEGTLEGLDIFEVDPLNNRLVLSTSDLSLVQIGTKLSGGPLDEPVTVREVTAMVSADGIRVEVWGGPSSQSELKSLLCDIVRRSVLGPLFGVYGYRVFRMSGDRVELQAIRADLGIPDLIPVPMRPGVSGAHAKLAPGDTVLVSFIDGDRRQPVAVGFGGRDENSEPEELDLSVASTLRLGSSSATDAVALAPAVEEALADIYAALDAISAATPISQDGGAAIQLKFKAVWDTANPPTSVSATKVVAE